METANPKDVYSRGDGTVQLQELMDVTSILTAAGVEHVGIVTKEPGDR
jgi:biopolymer transport protein ExbD